MIAVEAAKSVDDALCGAVDSLLPQLSRSAPPTREVLEQIVTDPATTVFVARDGERIVGLLTLVTFRILTGVRAWIEDVVVDDVARGAGAGSALVQAALEYSAQAGADRRPHIPSPP